MEETKKLKEQLFKERKNGNIRLSEDIMKRVNEYCEPYKKFLDICKTEREACKYSVELAEKEGFELFSKSKKYKPGDKAYLLNRDKNIVLIIFGNKPIEEGIKFAVAHIDSPRLDLKPNPVFEDDEIAYFKTHYYGGIKKYQWPAMPLALHGVIFKSNGEKVYISVGEEEGEVGFCISDLLPHLSATQMKRAASEFIEGESLNVIVGSRPFKDDSESEMVKLNILKILNEKYGITERDFLSAELEVVPAFKARDIGFDRGLIGAYGQDDRVCGYNALRAILDIKSVPNNTVVTMLADKEEIGSCGNTGMECNFFKYFVEDLGEMFNDTGRAGKAFASDASSEFTDKLTRLLDKEGIVWQTGEIGKIDIGGGGTVAMFVAKLNMDVIDVGVPLFSMHSPFELASKVDIFENYRAIHAFFVQD